MPTFSDKDRYPSANNQQATNANVKTSQKNSIEKQIEELNLSISKIARDLKKSRNLVYKWIRNPESMAIKDARILSAYLNIPLCNIVMDFNSSFCSPNCSCSKREVSYEK